MLICLVETYPFVLGKHRSFSLSWVKFSTSPPIAYGILLNNTGPHWKQDIPLAKYFLKVDEMVIDLRGWWEA